jgi:plastocyanin
MSMFSTIRRGFLTRALTPGTLTPGALTRAALTLAVAATAASANTEHVVTQVGTLFDPPEITAEPGDTIRWVHTGGIHTVTSGTSCTFDGLYFDEPLTAGDPIAEWVVPDDLEGEVPYFCRPHCAVDMIGVITIVADRCVADINGCGTVDFADLILILGAWGPCEDCIEDIDGSGAVDFGDILMVLGAWGACPP